VSGIRGGEEVKYTAGSDTWIALLEGAGS